jgi:uncharacterized membrane protein
MSQSRKIVCGLCGVKVDHQELRGMDLVRPGYLILIKKKKKDFDVSASICEECLNELRSDFVLQTMKESDRELSKLDHAVALSIQEQETVTENINAEYSKSLSFGQKLSDKIAEFGGSWLFIICFAVFLVGWMGVNSYLLLAQPFDPYPFILLNLVLSTLAAIQAPLIMMSQNRQEERDRLRAEGDYKVNLKAELEIQHLNDKLNFLIKKQWQKLMEIQRMQLEQMKTNNHNGSKNS